MRRRIVTVELNKDVYSFREYSILLACGHYVNYYHNYPRSSTLHCVKCANEMRKGKQRHESIFS